MLYIPILYIATAGAALLFSVSLHHGLIHEALAIAKWALVGMRAGIYLYEITVAEKLTQNV